LEVTTGGVTYRNTIAWVSATNTLYLTSDWVGPTGTFDAIVKKREIALPTDCVTVQNITNKTIGTPQPQIVISKFDRDDARLNPVQLGNPIAFIPSEAIRIPAPRVPSGIAVVAAAAGKGVRTLNIYMVNVWDLSDPTPSVYRQGVSYGRESALSKVASVTIGDAQEIELTPETLPNTTGLYRRYYFTCEAQGIKAPVRLRHASNTAPGLGVDTVSPAGLVTLKPDTSIATLSSQSFQATSIRYTQTTGVYQQYNLYPHPSGDTEMGLRYLRSPMPMLEDQDTPMIPESYAQVIAYAALEQVCLKTDNAPLSAVYARKKEVLFKGMEQRFLDEPAKRLIKGDPGSGAFWPNPFGPLRYTP